MQLILADWAVPSSDLGPKKAWGVAVDGNRLVAVGPHAELKATHPEAEVVDGTGQILLPGFVNGHVHLYGTLAHGIPLDDAPDNFWGFLEDYWWPKVEDALDVDMIVAATDYVCAEMLRSGITTFYDILEAPNALPEALLAQKDVVERRGLRGLLSFEATERAGERIARLGLEENLRLIDACATDSRGGGRGLVGGLMCWHTTFTCSDEFIQEAFALAADRGVLSHAHMNEGVHEGDWCFERTGRRTALHYDHLGVAGPEFLASQCVQIDQAELAVIAERGIRVTHMPLANCEVGGGIAPVPELLEAGATVGLGSDGYINDFFAVMRGAFLIHKARRQDPGVMPAATVLQMATEGGASALGLDDVGRLEVGYLADLQLIDA
ncbi:MAG: amidohydrolase family protein, partial [Acidimicrobiia bacterium]|nr:amidohydrolase family protein [Acidimicrobiia bacterium]